MRITINPDIETCERCDQNTGDFTEISIFDTWYLLCKKCLGEIEKIIRKEICGEEN